MSVKTKLGRRSFLGAGAAAAAGLAGVLSLPCSARSSARFVNERGCPDGPADVEARLPGVRDGALARCRLHIATPEGEQVVDLDPVVVRRGRAAVSLTLSYPFETRVPGSYAYYVEFSAPGGRAVTRRPALYSVRKIHWFA